MQLKSAKNITSERLVLLSCLVLFGPINYWKRPCYSNSNLCYKSNVVQTQLDFNIVFVDKLYNNYCSIKSFVREMTYLVKYGMYSELQSVLVGTIRIARNAV